MVNGDGNGRNRGVRERGGTKEIAHGGMAFEAFFPGRDKAFLENGVNCDIQI